MKRSVIWLFILSLACLSAFSVMSADGEKTGESRDECYALVEYETGSMILSENADKQVNCGYLGKLMSLLLIAEDIETGKYNIDSELTASETVRGTKGSVIWLEPGDKLSVDELLKGAIIGNANDAVTVLAEKSEGTIDNFVSRMNSEVFDLGLRNTAFYSPYGYYDEREHTTAADMAEICRKLAGYEFLRPYFKTWRCFIKNGTVELVNENTLSRTYSAHIGFKAAHSDQSGYCIAEGAESEDGTRYAAVVLGADDEKKASDRAKEILRRGFREYKVTATMFPDEMVKPIRVKKGIYSAVPVVLKEQSGLVIPKSAGVLRTVTVLPEYLSAPVRKGQVIGTAAFYDGKTFVYESEIIAAESVERINYKDIIVKMLLKVAE